MVLTCQRCGVKFSRRKGKGRPPKYCPGCSGDAANAVRKAYKEELKKNGWCVDCGKDVLPGRVRCAGCIERQREYMKEWNRGERRRKKNVD